MGAGNSGNTTVGVVTPDGFGDVVVIEESGATEPCDSYRGGAVIVNSAVELCKSDSSAGPDFANAAEKKFYRMSDKTLFDFCDEAAGVRDNCFNLETQKLTVGGIAVRSESYARMLRWK